VNGHYGDGRPAVRRSVIINGFGCTSVQLVDAYYPMTMFFVEILDNLSRKRL